MTTPKSRRSRGFPKGKLRTWNRVKSLTRYRFDEVIANGPAVLVAALAAAAFMSAAFAGVVLSVFRIFPLQGHPMHLEEATWESLMRTLDPGTMGSDTGWHFRAVMLMVTVLGILFVSTLIALINEGVKDTFDRMRKGRSRVVESGHTLILGWTPAIFTVLNELQRARRGGSLSGRVVVLADVDPVDMREEWLSRSDRLGRPPVFRRGTPSSPSDLQRVSPLTARSIIIMAPSGDHDDDALVRRLLGLKRLVPEKGNGGTPLPNIAVELRTSAHLELIDRIEDMSESKAWETLSPVVTDVFLAQLIAQTSLQPGLSAVYEELLGFEGVEFHLQGAHNVEGRSFAEICITSEKSCVGWIRQKEVVIAPSPGDICLPSDRLITIQDGDDVGSELLLTSNPHASANVPLVRTWSRSVEDAVSVLVLGWNERGSKLIEQLMSYVSEKSLIRIAYDETKVPEGMSPEPLEKYGVTVSVEQRNTTEREEIIYLTQDPIRHVIVLGYTGYNRDACKSDTDSLTTLIHLSTIQSRPVEVVSEMLEMRHRHLAEATNANGFVVSDQMMALRLTQAAINPDVDKVFDLLLSPRRGDMYLRKVGDYLDVPSGGLTGPVPFGALVSEGIQRSEVVVGYMTSEDQPDLNLSPPKADSRRYSSSDFLVIAGAGNGRAPSASSTGGA